MYILNHAGALIDIAKADCIHKSTRIDHGEAVYLIETDNGAEDEGFILGTYATKEERDKAYKNMVAFLKALDMRQFEEDEDWLRD